MPSAVLNSLPSVAAKAEPVTATKEIPRKGFKTWSLFLICNPTWLTGEKSQQIHKLYMQFESFGGAIGDDNLAVWFWKKTKNDKSHLEENIDVNRAARFCRAFGLKPSEGPHVVITTTYPSESPLPAGLPRKSAVFRLGNMSPDDISNLLSHLCDQLLANEPITDKSKQTPKTAAAKSLTDETPSHWVALLAAVQKCINSVGCAWTFKVDAGPVKADLHACQDK
jgi:hypothetical protein